MDLLLSLSLKQGPDGLEIAQQSYLWQLDLPGLYGGALRLSPEVNYSHTINYGYFGLGNASSGAPPPPLNPNPGRYYEWIDSFVQVRSGALLHMRGPLWGEFAAEYLHVTPGIYAASLLARDAAFRNPDGSPRIYGTSALSLLQVGNVPFFDLFQAGPFDQKEMPGGSAGVRGVPVGRYLGPTKVVGNIELRAMLVEFTVLRQTFTLGNDAFFDTGRVWSDYSFRSPLDGSGLGLKYGVGGGLYVLWG